MTIIDLSAPCTQTQLADLVGLTQPTVSILMSEGKLPSSGTVGDLLHAYCRRLREQAAGRMGETVGGLDLSQERAALARSQREAVDLRNAVTRGEYAPIQLLASVLATASQAVSTRFDQLPGRLKRVAPTLPRKALDEVLTVIADARNEWVRETSDLVVAQIELTTDDDTDAQQRSDLEADESRGAA